VRGELFSLASSCFALAKKSEHDLAFLRSARLRKIPFRLLRNLADASCGMLRVCVAFHALQFLQTIHLLCLTVLPLVLSVLILFALVEHSWLEKIDFGATIHAPFNEFEPIHIAF
jgi:hypothetical protein